MGFLSKSEPVAIDAALEKAVVNENERGLQKTLKLLSKNQVAILASIEDGETVAAIVGHGGAIPQLFSYVLVITNRRLLNFKKGRLDGSLQQSDVGRTRLFNPTSSNTASAQGAFLVAIETHEGMMYPDGDIRHFEPSRYLGIQLDDPRLARGVCAIIDAINGLTE
jgi:hypothetical protein